MDDGSIIPDIVLHIIGICSASLSVIGSFVILRKIIRGIRSTSPYDRFMLGLSTSDIIASITMLNFLDCHFLNPLWRVSSLCSVWYSGLLSAYFLLRVLSQLKQKDLVKKNEGWLHGSLILVIVYYYFISVRVENDRRLVFDSDSMCYIDDPTLYYRPSGYPYWFSYFLITINYSVIYDIVQNQIPYNQGPSPELYQRKRNFTTLMILYVGSFFVTYTPYLFLGFQDSFPMRLLVAATFPLRGFWNAFIYFKPAYARVRASHPSKSIFFVLHQVLLSRSNPRLHRHRDGQHVTGGSVYVTDITRNTVRIDSNANTEDDAGYDNARLDFLTRLFIEVDPFAEDDNSPLEAVAEERPVDSNS